MSQNGETHPPHMEEVQELRRRITELEQQLSECRATGLKERMPRYPMEADIEFIGDFDIINAKGVNISSGGICLMLSEDLPFEMQFEQDGRMQQRRAYLIWLRRLETGGYHFGFKFVEEQPSPQF